MNVRFINQAPPPPNPRVTYAPGKRPAPRWRWYALLAIVGSPAVIVSLQLSWGAIMLFLGIDVAGQLTFGGQALRSVGTGRVTALPVAVGGAVSPGTMLASIEDPSLIGDRVGLEGQLNALAIAPNAVPQASDLSLQLAKQRSARTTEYLATIMHLASQNAATAAEVRQAQSEADAAAADLARLETVAPNDVAARRAVLLAQMRGLDEREHALDLTSSVNGSVQTISVRVGDLVRAGDAVVVVSGHGDPSVKAFIPVSEANLATVGRKGTIRFPDGRTVAVHVASLSGATTNSDGGAVAVTLALDEPFPATEPRIEELPLRVHLDRH